MNRLFSFFSRNAPLREASRVYDLKARLDWGEPALTIIDVRDRDLFNESHIMGAISMPRAELIPRAIASLEFDRDLYVYAGIDEEAKEAAHQLRAVGYQRVSIVRGGVAAWKAAGFPIETTAIAV